MCVLYWPLASNIFLGTDFWSRRWTSSKPVHGQRHGPNNWVVSTTNLSRKEMQLLGLWLRSPLTLLSSPKPCSVLRMFHVGSSSLWDSGVDVGNAQLYGRVSPAIHLAALSHDSPLPRVSVLWGHWEQCGLGASHVGTIPRAGKPLKKQTQPAHNAACSRAEAKQIIISVFCLKCSIFQRNGEKEGVPYTPHTTMFSAAGTLPLGAPCPFFLGELVQCAQVPRQQAQEISNRDCIFTFSCQILWSSQRCTTQGAKMSPSCFYSHCHWQPYYMFTWSPIPLTVPSWQQSATFIKLCKSLLLCVASWTSTEYIFTARTRFWANFLYSLAKIHDIYVKETFIFCFIIAVRNWGMWIKLSFIQTEDRVSFRDSW